MMVNDQEMLPRFFCDQSYGRTNDDNWCHKFSGQAKEFLLTSRQISTSGAWENVSKKTCHLKPGYLVDLSSHPYFRPLLPWGCWLTPGSKKRLPQIPQLIMLIIMFPFGVSSQSRSHFQQRIFIKIAILGPAKNMLLKYPIFFEPHFSGYLFGTSRYRVSHRHRWIERPQSGSRLPRDFSRDLQLDDRCLSGNEVSY